MPVREHLATISSPKAAGDTVQESTYRHLRRSIMIGEVRPGVALTIRGLAEKLEVSPTPVREALRRLCAERALTLLDNRRVMVPTMDVQKFEELLALRIALETHAADRALPYINESLINELVVIDKSIDKAIEKGHYEEAIIANQQFHAEIYMANPDQKIMPMVESIWLQLGPFVRLAVSNLETFYRFDRHQEAVAALRQRDPLALRVAIEADIRDGIGHIGREGLLREFVASRGTLP